MVRSGGFGGGPALDLGGATLGHAHWLGGLGLGQAQGLAAFGKPVPVDVGLVAVARLGVGFLAADLGDDAAAHGFLFQHHAEFAADVTEFPG